MAKLSKTLRSGGIPTKCKEEMSKCCFCGEDISHGGMWAAANHHLGICEKCAPLLIDWYADTLMDTSDFEELKLDEKINLVMATVEKRLEKKEGMILHMRNIRGLEKMGIKYYSELGIIDFFGLALSDKELKERIRFDESDLYGTHSNTGYTSLEESDIDRAVLEISQVVEEHWGEKPHTVKFFGIPDFEYLKFSLCAIAKISDNGSTIVFANNERIITVLDENGHSRIYEVSESLK